MGAALPSQHPRLYDYYDLAVLPALALYPIHTEARSVQLLQAVLLSRFSGPVLHCVEVDFGFGGCCTALTTPTTLGLRLGCSACPGLIHNPHRSEECSTATSGSLKLVSRTCVALCWAEFGFGRWSAELAKHPKHNYSYSVHTHTHTPRFTLWLVFLKALGSLASPTVLPGNVSFVPLHL